MIPILSTLRRFDWSLMLAAFTLFCLGLAAIFSVELSHGDGSFVLLQKQLIALAIGLVALVALAAFNYYALRNYATLLYVLGLILLVAVLLFGRTFNGTTGWFVVGGFAFQPIEFMKFALIIMLAKYFGEYAKRRLTWSDIGKSGLLFLLPAFLVLRQPDLGGAALLFGIWAIMLFFAGLRLAHVGAMATVAVVLLGLGWLFLFAPYQKERLLTFIDPTADPLDTGYNVAQAKIAIGAGGLLGTGLGEGSQSQLRFLPESQTDFIFAVIAEELGFFGVSLLFFIFVVFLGRMLKLAERCRDTFSAFLCLGVFAVIIAQTLVHVGANVALLPATGVALPFVSYGGTALLLSCMFLGLLESIASRLREGDVG